MHVDEEQLQRLVDDELAEPADDWTREHIGHCDSCRERVERARSEQDEVFALLGSLDHRRPRVDHLPLMARGRRADRRWMRKAAGFVVIAILSGVAYAASGSSLRSFVDRVFTPEEKAAVTTVTPGNATESRVSGVTVTAENRMVIAFASAQSSGDLRITLGPGNEVEVRASGPGVSYSSGEESLGVDNARSIASYSVVIPRRLAAAEIRIAGHRVFLKDGDRIVTDAPESSTGEYLISLVR